MRRKFIKDSAKAGVVGAVALLGASVANAKSAESSQIKHIIIKGATGDMQRAWGYASAVQIGNIVKISGLGGWDEHFNFPHKSLDDEVRQALDNVSKVLESCGSSWKRVYSVTSYFVPKLNEANQQVLVKHFKSACVNPPIWTNVQVAGLGDPRMCVEIVVKASI